MILSSVGVAAAALVGACVGDDPSSTDIPDASTGDTGAVRPPALTSGGSGTGESSSGDDDSDANCNGSLCSEVCVNLETDPRNCGACGIACGGSAECTQSKCQPELLASNLDSPFTLAVFNGVAAIGGSHSLATCPLEGCPGGASLIFDDVGYALDPIALQVSPAGTEAYFFANGPVDGGVDAPPLNPYKSSLTGPKGLPEPQWLGNPSYFGPIQSFAVDEREMFIASGYSLRRCLGLAAPDGCRSSSWRREFHPTTVGGTALTPDFYVWNQVPDDGSNLSPHLWKCPRPVLGATSYETCAPVSIAQRAQADSSGIGPLTLHHETAFWLETTHPMSSTKGWAVVSCPLNGCVEPLVLARGEGAVQRIAADSGAVYWTSELTGEIRRCANLTAGCGESPETVVSGVTAVRAIAVASGYLYFTDAGSSATTPVGKFFRLKL